MNTTKGDMMWLVIEEEIIEGYYTALGNAFGVHSNKAAAAEHAEKLNRTKYADAGGEMSAVIVEVPVIS
jgi:hypothetical protein